MINRNTIISDKSIHITNREQEVLDLLCQGYTSKEIAKALYLSPYTVESHKKNLISKCGGRNVVNMVYRILCTILLVFSNLIPLIGQTQYPVNVIHVHESFFLKGRISDQTIEDRIQDLSDSFAPAGISFYVKDIDTYRNSECCFGEETYTKAEAERFIKKHNDPNAINIYVTDFPFEGRNGIAEFPESYSQINIDDTFASDDNNSVVTFRDGFINNSGVLQHEIGHFFGLFHTFHSKESNQDEPILQRIGNCRGLLEELLELQDIPGPLGFHGDGIADTKPILNISMLKKSLVYRNYKDYFSSSPKNCTDQFNCCIDLFSSFESDPEVWHNYMQYNDEKRTTFTQGQIDVIESVNNLPERTRLQNNSSFEKYTELVRVENDGSVEFVFQTTYIDHSLLQPNNSFAKSLNSGIYRLQVIKNSDKNFTYNSGFHDSWQYGANSTVVVDEYISVINGQVSFTWSGQDLPSIYEGPQIGETYKAVLAREYADPQSTGFYTFSDELIFTVQSQSCDAASGLYNSNIRTSEAYFGWDEVDGSADYDLTLYRDGNDIFCTQTPNNGIRLTQLRSNTEYCWDITTRCSNGATSTSTQECFTTDAITSNDDAGGDLEVRVDIENASMDIAQGSDVELEIDAIWDYTQPGAPIEINPVVSIYLSTSNSESGIIKSLGSTTMRIVPNSSINSGSRTVSNNLEVYIDQSVDPGQYWIYVEIDEDNNYAEQFEGNNSWFDGFDVVAGSTGTPGCTNSNAHNYNPTATTDDGSCETCSDDIWNGDEEGTDCGGSKCAPCASCIVTTEMRESLVTNTEVTVEWDAGDNVSHYWVSIYEYPNGSLTEFFHEGNDRDRTFRNLVAGNSYCWYLRSSCNGVMTTTESRCFTTTSNTCLPPDQLYEEDVWEDEAVLKWHDPLATDPDVYFLRYRKKGTTNWIGQSQFTHGAAPDRFEYFRSVSDLEFCTEYEWQVRKFCDVFQDNSEWSPLRTFTSNCRTTIGDFYISNISIDDNNIQPNEVYNAVATVSYYGDSPNSLRPKMFYYLSTDLSAEPSERITNSNGFPQEESYSVRAGFRHDEENRYLWMNDQVPAGTYNLILCIDGNNEFSEIDENNNCSFVEVKVGIEGCTDPQSHNYNDQAEVDNGICETCDDGIRNGDEIEVDCGGVLCAPCSQECIPVPTLTGTFGAYYLDLNWSDPNSYGSYSILLRKETESDYTEYFTTDNNIYIDGLEPETRYLFRLRTYCNGTSGESVLFASTMPAHIDGCTYLFSHNYDETASINDGSCQTCFDDIKNGDETDIDCGGMLCDPCDCQEVNYLVDYNIYSDYSLHVQQDATAQTVIYFSDALIRAGNSITFEPGFEVVDGSTLLANIEEETSFLRA